MTRRSGADDLADEPFLDDTERAEFDWLIARETDPAAPPPSAKIASDHAELEDLLGSLPEGPPDDRWHEEVLRLASPPAVVRPWWRRATGRWAIGGACVAAAAIAMWLAIPRTPAELEVAIRHDATRGDLTRGDPARGDAALYDVLVVTARPREPAELRVYHSGGALMARCPGGPSCTSSAPGELAIEITLDQPGPVQVLLVAGAVPAAIGETMDAYLEAVHRARARIVTHGPIYVQ